MSIAKLLNDPDVRTLVERRLEGGESFELISFCSDEKMTSEEVKQKISSKNLD